MLGIFGGQQAGRIAGSAEQRSTLATVSPSIISPTAPAVTATLSPALQAKAPHSGNAALLLRAVEVLDALKISDFKALASIVAPEGLTLTPLSTVDRDADLTFTPREVSGIATNSKHYVWGTVSGTAAPIELTPLDYFQQYVYNADYSTAPSIGVDQVLCVGNALENVKETYPDCHFVEFHFPGIDPKKEGFDWCSLKVVFRTIDETPMLVGLIHSEWTT